MKKIFILFALFLYILNLKAQESGKVMDSSGISEEPVFTKVEIQAQFPGGEGKFNEYIKRELQKNISELVKDNQGGTCEIQFIVHKDGKVSNVEVLTMKGSKLAEVVIDAIKKGPKWTPAVQNGVPVKAWHRQKVTFRLPEKD